MHDLAPKNAKLLAERDRLQAEMDAWHKAHPGPIAAGDVRGSGDNMSAYRAFLEKIGYLLPQPKSVKATTANVDAELASQAGPQLVVPILNARYALNAANARWGSLYDALYGTDAIPETGGAEKGQGYNEVRGDKVIAFARRFLDEAAPLADGSHAQATGYSVDGGKLVVALKGGRSTGLARAGAVHRLPGRREGAVVGAAAPHGLHIDIRIDRSTTIGQGDAAGVSDVVLEAALSTILDLEDSVAVVDAAGQGAGLLATGSASSSAP